MTIVYAQPAKPEKYTATLSTSVTASVKDQVRKAADAANATMAEWLRQVVAAKLRT